MAHDLKKRAAGKLAANSDWPEPLRKIRARTPARILVGRAGPAYRTETQLQLREDHAAARDAVRAELDVNSAVGAGFVEKWKLFEVGTRASSKDEYLQHPSLGRAFNEASRAEIVRRCVAGCDLQIAIGDGLSVPAIGAHILNLCGQMIKLRVSGVTLKEIAGHESESLPK